MSGEKASVVITDPPYNVAIDGHVGGKGNIHHREFAMASGEMSANEFQTFLRSFMALLAQYTSDGSLHYIFMDWRHTFDLLRAGEQVYDTLKNIVVWVKSNGGMGSLYRSQHEFVFVFKKGDAPHRNNVQLGRHGRNRTNVWQYAGANGFDGRITERPLWIFRSPQRRILSGAKRRICRAPRRQEQELRSREGLSDPCPTSSRHPSCYSSFICLLSRRAGLL